MPQMTAVLRVFFICQAFWELLKCFLSLYTSHPCPQPWTASWAASFVRHLGSPHAWLLSKLAHNPCFQLLLGFFLPISAKWRICECLLWVLSSLFLWLRESVSFFIFIAIFSKVDDCSEPSFEGHWPWRNSSNISRPTWEAGSPLLCC